MASEAINGYPVTQTSKKTSYSQELSIYQMFQEKCPVRTVCDDKNCQSAKHMCFDEECHENLNLKELILFMQSGPKTDCK